MCRNRFCQREFRNTFRCATAGRGCAMVSAGSRGRAATPPAASGPAGFGARQFGGRVIAGPGADHRTAGTVRHHTNLAERPVERLVGWRVCERVLAADIVRHLVRDAVYVREFLWIIDLAAGSFG